MATAIAGTSQKGCMQDWKTLFPKTDYTTIEGSAAFIKKLIAVSLSSISYMRGIFPEHAFGERKLGGLRLKVLNENCGVKAVSSFIDLIRGCYDAVEKNYLHQLSIGICLNPENRNEVIEAYKLEFKYKDDECSITCHNKRNAFSPKQNDPTVQASFLMLKNIYTVSDLLGPLPKCPYITLKLLYYDEVTPPEYEPPGFEPSAEVKFNFPEKCLNIDLGKVDTNNHGFKFLLKSSVRKPSLTQPEDPLLEATQSQANGFCTDNSVHSRSESLISNRKGLENSERHSFKCLCECKAATDVNTITCVSCEKKQHKVCYGIIQEEDTPDVFYCVDCVILNTDGKEPTDLAYKYRGKELKEFCAMRRALMVCASRNLITRQDIEKCLGCTKAFSNSLMEHLEFKGYLTITENKGVYAVDETHLYEIGWKSFFPVHENDENEDPAYQIDMNDSLSKEVDEEAMNEETPERYNKQNDSRILRPKNSKKENYISSPVFETQTQSPEYDSATIDDINNVESSIKKVKKLSIDCTASDGATGRKSRKRKASAKGITINDSEELFQSQSKRPRRKKKV